MWGMDVIAITPLALPAGYTLMAASEVILPVPTMRFQRDLA